MADSYATLAEAKTHLRITVEQYNTELTDLIADASRDLDKDTGRYFGLDTVASQRVFNPAGRVVYRSDGQGIVVDDIGTEAGLVVEVGSGTSWTAVTDYRTEPENATARGLPVTMLRRTSAMWLWPGTDSQVRVTARWGWPAVPGPIRRATLLRVARLWRRKDSPEGIAGFGDMGVVRVGRADPDYEALIAAYVLPGFG